LAFIDSILIKDPNCDPKRKKCDAYQASINIDPALFSTYGVQTVPAIVYARGISEMEMEEGQGAAALDAFMVTGDVTFDYALEMITRESKSSQTENILKKLRRGFY
jgi:type-F conjugative transfer system pilin assembly protein TrbC